MNTVLILSLLVLCMLVSLSIGQECQSLVTCSDCLARNASCGWCNDENVFRRLASDFNTQLQPAALCRLPEELAMLGCTDIINPQGTQSQQEVRVVDEDPSVSPQMVQLSLRPGIPQSFNITVRPPSSISVDMYILMDLSFTMRDDLQNLRRFADELVEQMQNLTDEFRIGFGSFIDKPVSPFIDRNVNFSCAADYPVVTEEQCERTYAFRHRLDLTDRVGDFKTELINAKISGSVDQAEATLDALLQVAACQNEIGWRDVGEARRLILVLTDGDYHIALDGKLAGLREAPSKECRLNPVTKQYDFASQVDYPSSTLLADILNEQRMIPIFAVEKSVRTVYDQLSDIIRSAFVGELTSNSDNLLDLISSQYTRLSTTVVPVVNRPGNVPELSITVAPINNCSDGVPLEGSTCTDIIFPDNVTYTVSMTMDSSYCDRTNTESMVHQLGVLFIGFGDVLINVTTICSCDCEMNRVPNSPLCSNVGTYECSTCICPTESFNGPQCQCPARSIGRSTGCRPSGGNVTEVCSNRGRCECNECICDQINGRSYQGQYCECDTNACPSGLDENGRVLPCSGHGTCGCDTSCICDSGYSGISCDCPSVTNTCIGPADSDSGVQCTGAGQCTCGTCVCDDYSIRSGTYCEDCGVCVRSCNILSECVRCFIEDNCGPSCAHVNVTIPFISSDNTTRTVLRTCPVPHDSCEVVFQVGVYILGSEDSITVYLDMTQSGIANWRDGCDNQLQIWIIPVVIVVAIIVLVIIILALWKGITFLLEYLEFKAWKESQESEMWNTSGDNPLFVDPTTSHMNPKYRSRPVNIQQSPAH